MAGERITMLNGIVARQSDAMFLLILLVVVMFAVSGAVWYAYRRQAKTKGACLLYTSCARPCASTILTTSTLSRSRLPSIRQASKRPV